MNFFRASEPIRLRGFALLATAFLIVSGRAQLILDDVEIRGDGLVEVRFGAAADSYYRLLSGTTVEEIRLPVVLSLTPPLIAPPSDAPSRFFRVQQVPRLESLDTDGDLIPDIYELQHPFLNGLNSGDAAADPDGDGRSALREYQDSLDADKLTTISATFPIAGEAGVSVNRETVVHFSAPLAAGTVLTSQNFFAGFGGRKFLSRVDISSDRRKATLFYLEPIPGSVRISAVFDAAGIKDTRGREVDADGDGTPGGLHLLQFDTYSTTPISGTSISGFVYASEPVPDGSGGFTNKPIPGVTITVDGAEETMRAVTAENGRFTLVNCPSGRFFVHVDGRTSPLSAWPDGQYYPNIGKAWTAVGGRADNVAPGDGTIFLPLIPAATLQPVSMTEDTVVRLSPEVVAANPNLAGVKLVVPANSLFDNDGRRGGMVGIAIVDPERLPEPLPAGLAHLLDITVQSDGPQNFDRPVPACFPNVPNQAGFPMAPGARAVLMSFNHDTGKWETVGGMTVSDDGKLVCTDPGVGIRQPGWHGMEGPPPVNPPPRPPLTDTGPFSPPTGDGGCKSKTDGNCQTNCNETKNGADRDCDRNFDVANAACSSVACQQKAASDRDECKGAASTARGKCLPSCTVNVCAAGGPAPSPRIAPRRIKPAAPIAHSQTPEEAASTLLDQVQVILLQIAGEGRAPTDSETAQIRSLLDEVRVITGPDANAFWSAAAATHRSIATENDLFSWSAPAYPIYRATFNVRSRLHLVTGGFKLLWQNAFFRDQTEPYGQYQVFLPQSSGSGQDGREATDTVRIDNWFYDSRTHSVGRSSIAPIRVSGLPRFLPSFTLAPMISRLEETAPLFDEFVDSRLRIIPTEVSFGGANIQADEINAAITRLDGRDTDDDGLSDLAEFIIGTDPRKSDTDGDRIADGAEIDQGLNPLDGRPAAVGIIGAVPAPGEAVDVAAFNDRAIVALTSSGVALFDVAAERLGVLIARLEAPGDVKVVALSQDFAVAGGSFEGLLVLDPRNATPTLRRIFVGGDVTAVAVEGGFAWIGTAGAKLLLLDLSTGVAIDTINLPAPAMDIALEGGVVAVALNQQLHTFEQIGGAILFLGQVNLGLSSPELVTGRRRVFAGDGMAFVNDLNGFARFDLADPAAPFNVSTSQSYGPASFKQIVPTGSGFGLAVVGASPGAVNAATHNVQVFDLRDPAVNNNAGLIIRTPGVARAAALYNGLAYVADGAAGLQIINFLASDTGTNPPSITLRTSASAGRAEEGHLLRLSAEVADDVQVRVVEFYEDGQRVAIDGSFPFEVAFLAPSRTATTTNVIVRARAIDTGGNATWSDELNLELIPDATAPRVLRTSPASGELAPSISSILAVFSEPLDAETVTPAAIKLLSAGADGILGTTDDVGIPDYALDLRDVVPTVAVTIQTVLPPGAYRLTFTPLVKDLAGNSLPAAVNVDFTLYDTTKDSDGDGLPDDLERFLGLDFNKVDSNGNGIPDGREDADGDGLRNSYEVAFGLNPLRNNSDGNAIPDGDEDRDHDGLSEKREQAAGTNPLVADTDSDGWSDEAELTAGSNPTSALSKPFLLTSARPPVEFIAPRVDLGIGRTFGTTVAQPPVEVIAPRVLFSPGQSFGTTLAQPPVEVIAPRVAFSAGLSFGTTVARPPVEALAPRVEFSGGLSFGTTVARPPIEALAPRVMFGSGVSFGTTFANPPVELLAPRILFNSDVASGVFLARPEISIEFVP